MNIGDAMNNSDGDNQPDDGAGCQSTTYLLMLPEKFDGTGNFEE